MSSDSERLSPLTISRPGLVVPVRLDPTGVRGPTAGKARGPQWRRASWGYYVPMSVDPTTPEQRIVEAAVVLRRYGGVTGWAALRWHGGYWFDGTTAGGSVLRDVTLVTSTLDFRRQTGIHVCGEGIAPYELIRVDGLPVGTALQAVCFEARYARDLRAAVRILDMAAYSDLASTAEVVEYASQLRGRTGIPQLRAASAHMEENAWSPVECDTRLVWTIDAELPPLLANRPVFDLRGRHIGTPDLLDDEAGLVIEYDGGMHLEGQQRRVDRDRDDRYRALGLDVVMVMADDHRERDGLAARFRRARRRAKFAAISKRLWTVEPPPWWISTATVTDRRALDVGQRRRLLRYRQEVG